MKITIPFGERKGWRCRAHQAPSSILKWLAEKAYNDKVATAADEEWQYREKHNVHHENYLEE